MGERQLAFSDASIPMGCWNIPITTSLGKLFAQVWLLRELLRSSCLIMSPW